MKKPLYWCLAALFMALTSCGNGAKSNTSNADTIAIEKADTVKTISDDDAIEQITTLYNDAVLHPLRDVTPVIERLCTDSLKQKLAAAYDYDGEGYAVWKFRTGLQDGDGDSRVNEIKPIGDGWYEVDFTDMGWHGTKKIKVIERDGKLLIDDYK